MTTQNILFLISGIALASIVSYYYSLFSNYKKVAAQKARKAIELAANAKSISNAQGKTALSSITAPLCTTNFNQAWQGKHFPRLEDMF